MDLHGSFVKLVRKRSPLGRRCSETQRLTYDRFPALPISHLSSRVFHMNPSDPEYDGMLARRMESLGYRDGKRWDLTGILRGAHQNL